ncbi:hypothetical protein CABS03_07893 [Colletotrichum abscissum]|uniref:Uncharacterized protein n=1 Tax=Colletotrichum abscissum TaxID=1671311 RepID=A0A9P9X9U5_9PEZI|nr:hypothetical protein CABS02_09662 [Colletotrichum abscissum]
MPAHLAVCTASTVLFSQAFLVYGYSSSTASFPPPGLRGQVPPPKPRSPEHLEASGP